MTKPKTTSKTGADIDANLKRAFDQVLEEQVPDRFLDLLSQLRAADNAPTNKGNHNDA